LTSSKSGWVIDIEFEDQDRYRLPEGDSPCDPVGNAAWRLWQKDFSACWQILATRHPASAESITSSLSSLIPLASGQQARGQSATSRDANGAARMDRPRSPMEFAVTLIHETEHNKLNALHGLVPLFESTEATYYSPWRDDPRPASGLLHGVYAFRAVAGFWLREYLADSSRIAEFEFARVARQVQLGCDSLAEVPLTAAGRSVAAATEAVIDPWRELPVSAEARRLAEDLAAAHRVRWHLHHVSKLDTSPASWPSLYRMARQWFVEGNFPVGGEEADRLLIMGDYGAANALYAEDIMGSAFPEWACVGLLTVAERLDEAAGPWHTRPQLANRVSEIFGLDAPSILDRIRK
jgi:hypothetical protein